MKVTFRKSFERDLKKIREHSLRRRVREAIEQIEAAKTFQDIPHLQQLSGAAGFARIRLGDYRLGVFLERDTIDLVRFLHRREIYRRFP